MSFHPEKTTDFLDIFTTSKLKIRGFDGCEHLELYRDKKSPNIFFTYSYWKSESHLNAYRNSTYFAVLWKSTKSLFNDKPEAWSVDRLCTVDNPLAE